MSVERKPATGETRQAYRDSVRHLDFEDRGSFEEAARTGELGFWHRSIGGPPVPRDPLPGPIEADVAVVGAGFTGLWTAYYLKKANPGLNVVVLESRFAGFGASGRNGGWLMGACEGSSQLYARRGGPEAVIRLRREMRRTVAEVEDVIATEGIDADLERSGALTVAIGPAQEQRLRQVATKTLGNPVEGGEEDRLLERDELGQRLRISGARCALFHPVTARIHPARLVRGLAAVVEKLDVPIFESTPVGKIERHRAVTERGDVSARWVVRATEAYTPSVRGEPRTLVPVNSSMIVTEPLAAKVWDEIGWAGSELVGDAANVFFYMQRTADGRIAIGGRGVPYRYGSAPDFGGEVAPRTVNELAGKIRQMFPVAGSAAIAHGWSGVIGVPRDWGVSVNADRATGLAWAGGYSGEGVAAANLAARCLRDLILGRESGLTRLPWVGHQPPRWEPEPLRYVGVRSLYAGYRFADRIEDRTGKPSVVARIFDRISGR